MFLGSHLASMCSRALRHHGTTILAVAIGVILSIRSSAAGSNGRVVVATSERGTYYYHGTLMPAPYSIAVGYTIDSGDTLWSGIYINDIPLHPEPVGRPLSSRAQVETVRNAAMRTAVRKSGIALGTPPAQTARMLAAAYARIPGLVDSARAVSDTELAIYWSGSTKPDRRPLSSKPFAPPQDGSVGLISMAQFLSSFLNAGLAVLATSAGELTVPVAQIPVLNAEIADIRKGVVRKYLILDDPRQVAEFRSPNPLPIRKD